MKKAGPDSGAARAVAVPETVEAISAKVPRAVAPGVLIPVS